MGGFYDTLVFGGILAIFTTVSACMGIVNIKLKQIDQHRKWMMRAWVYAASIIVSQLRPILTHPRCVLKLSRHRTVFAVSLV